MSMIATERKNTEWVLAIFDVMRQKLSKNRIVTPFYNFLKVYRIFLKKVLTDLSLMCIIISVGWERHCKTS